MKLKRGLPILVGVFLAGLVSAFVAPEGFDVLIGLAVFSALIGLMQLAYAGLLANRMVAASATLGFSPLGQAMQGTACLLMCAMLVADRSWSPAVGSSVGLLYLALFFVGMRVEHKARDRHPSAHA